MRRFYTESGYKKQTGSWRDLPIPGTLADVVNAWMVVHRAKSSEREELEIMRGFRSFYKNSSFKSEKQITGIQLSNPQRAKSPTLAQPDCWDEACLEVE